MNHSILFVLLAVIVVAFVLYLNKSKPSEVDTFVPKQNEVYKTKPETAPYTLPILVISLPESTRRQRMKEMFKNYPGMFVFIDGVRVRNHKDRVEQLKILGLDISENDPYVKIPGDFGCAMAHLRAHMFIVQQNLPMALILEDDVHVEGNLDEVLNHLKNYQHPPNAADYHHIQNYTEHGNGAQIVTNHGARMMLKNADAVLRNPVDMSIRYDGIEDIKLSIGPAWFSIYIDETKSDRIAVNKSRI